MYMFWFLCGPMIPQNLSYVLAGVRYHSNPSHTTWVRARRVQTSRWESMRNMFGMVPVVIEWIVLTCCQNPMAMVFFRCVIGVSGCVDIFWHNVCNCGMKDECIPPMCQLLALRFKIYTLWWFNVQFLVVYCYLIHGSFTIRIYTFVCPMPTPPMNRASRSRLMWPQSERFKDQIQGGWLKDPACDSMLFCQWKLGWVAKDRQSDWLQPAITQNSTGLPRLA